MAQLKRYNGSSWETVGGSIAPKNTHTSSTTDTYSCDYINDKLDLFNITEIPLTFSSSGTDISINMELGVFTIGLLIVQGLFEGGSNVYFSGLINYGTRYSPGIIQARGTNINNSTISLQNSGNTIQMTCTANVPTGIGSVKAVLIQLV